MGGIYTGLAAQDGFVFITNDIFGSAEDESAIAWVNKFCGALIVTAQGNFLIRVKKVLNGCLSELNNVGEGVSVDLSRAIIESFETQFQNDPSFTEDPLPFLLLLVGRNRNQPACIEHIFVRNRVVKILEKGQKREYITEFDIQPPTPARSLFYGRSELSQYLLQQMSSADLNLEAVKLSAYLSMRETQKIDKSLYPGIRMAVLSTHNGFEWIPAEELQRLSELGKTVESNLNKRIYGYFTSSGNSKGRHNIN